MAEYERRNHGYKGGRKRRYRDDDDFDRRAQRRKYEEPLSTKVRKQLLMIADSAARRVEDDALNLAKIVTEHHDDIEARETFLELINMMIVEQPFKIPFLAALVLAINCRRTELASEVINQTRDSLQKALEDGDWRDVKLFVRFLSCLQGLFKEDGVFPLLEELFSRAVDLQTASSEDSLGLELVKIILLAIPYVMSSSATDFESHATNLLEKTDIIASTPHALVALVDPFAIEEDNPEVIHTFIGLLQRQLQDESGQNWKLNCLPRPWKFPETGGDDNTISLESSPKISFPEINVPNPVKQGPRIILPEIYLSMYAGQEFETVPPTSDIASTLLRDILTDTINVLDFNRVAAAKYLIDVDCYCAPDIFVKRATPFDKLRDIPEGRTTWKPEDIAVDAVFSQLFQLPVPEHKFVYYHSVLTECCKIAPAAIAPSLGRAIRYLYRNTEKMDLDLVHRFVDWFAHHLSNFGFTWKWTEWIEDLDLPVVHPKMAFITGALDKEIRLSFAQRIKGTLPEPYQTLIPEGKENETPEFKYTRDSTPYAAEGRELMQLIRKKAIDEEIQPLIHAIEEEARTHVVSDPLIPSTDAFVTSICFVGAKSLSHVLSCIERNKDRLLAIGPRSPAARRQIITSVIEHWADQPGIAINIIDKLLNYTILTPLSVIEWVLIDKVNAGRILSKMYAYEMISATIGKVTNRIRQIVAARIHPGVYEPQLSVLDETLNRERKDMALLFGLIEGCLSPIASGSHGELLERDDGSDDKIIRQWGQRWLRVFRRKSTVEEAFITDAMVNVTPLGTVAPIPQPQAVDQQPGPMPDMDVPDDSVNGNGALVLDHINDGTGENDH